MESKAYLQSVITKIEQNIFEKINIGQLSSEYFISTRQLYRDFYCYTGHSINEYIRKRRLSKALSLLKHSSMSLSYIASECGYSSQQAFCKQIKSTILMTPAEYINSPDIYYFPICEGKKIRQIVIQNKMIPEMICLKYYNSQLIGIEDKAIKYLQSVLHNYNGTLFGRNGQQRGSKFCYELYIDYNEKYINTVIKCGLEFSITTEYNGVFAFTTTKNNEQEINDTWDYIYGNWLKNSMFELDNTPYFEEYILNDNIIKKLILHLPVKRRENFYKISFNNFNERLFLISSKRGLNAEKDATKKLINFVSNYHPYFFTTQKEFYISMQNGWYFCGINLDNPVSVPRRGIKHLNIPQGTYAVLEGSCFKNHEEYEQILTNWLQENGFETDGEPFSIYDTSRGMDKKEIIIKSQIKIKDGRII